MSKQKAGKPDPSTQIPSHSHAPIKEYALITLEQNHALQMKNDSLIQRVRNTTIFINGLYEAIELSVAETFHRNYPTDAEKAVQERDKEKREKAEWQAYLSCDKLPKPFEPETVRNFIYKTSQFENEEVEHTINWLLGVDERSILSQDIDSVNLTKRFLQDGRGDFGELYDVRINEVMAVSRRIEDFLEKPTRQLSERILNDVKEMKFLAYKQINNFIDNLTYRVLCSEEAYMSSIDVTTAEYSHQAQHFGIHLWTFKNVPICLDPEETPSKRVELYKIKVDLVLPFSVLSANMVIRGLHCHFDHFSAIARYFALPENDEDTQNLITILQREWETQKKIQAEVRANMVKQREDFEEALRLKAEEEELKAKQLKQKDGKDAKARPKKPDPSAKPKKGPKEPPIVTPDLVPQIREDFLKHDRLEYEEFLRKFHPDTFGLSNGEVNLRKYQILGGVYQLNSLSKPKADSFPKLIIAWYRTSNSVQYKSVQSDLTDDISKFFQITFELPEHFCHWGVPTPCLFEESTAYRSSNDTGETANLLHISSPVIINDFNLHELFTKPLMYDFIEHSMPRVISSFEFPEDLYNEDEDKKSKTTLGRTKPTIEDENKEKELVMQRQVLSFDVQNCPERLFPLFKKVLPVVILPTQEQDGKAVVHPYEHFSDFIAALEAIKESYCRSSFKDNRRNPIKISADKYEKYVRRHKKDAITSKLVVHGKTGRTLIAAASKESLSEADVLRKSVHHDGDNPKALNNRASKMASVSEVEEAKKCEEEEPSSKWSTANILKTQFIASDRKVTIWTDRLGTFGFAFDRYQHFPFKHWSLEPCKENPQEVQLTVESAFAVFRIYISPDGYKACVTDFTKYYKSRKVYLEIKEPVSDFKTLKEKLQQKHLNIFPERDAALYVTGYFSEKHLATELHNYNCISLYATSLQFGCSLWNKLSDRRSMVLKLGELRDLDEDFHLLRVTPEDVTFVDVRELCTDLETIELEYTPTWRNIEWYPDLNHLITSTFNDASDMRLKNPSVICYLKELLQNIRPLSFS